MKDYETALKYFLDAASLGNSASQNNIGYMYKNGIGVEKNLSIARKYFMISSNAYNHEASENFKLIDDLDTIESENRKDVITKAQDDHETYENTILSKARNNDKLSQYFMGYGYYYGVGQEKDYVQALYWFKKSAEQGLIAAEYHLGIMYEQGYGTLKNEGMSFYWYQKSAMQNFYPSQILLSSKFYSGKGTNKDLVLSYAWASIASANNNVGTDQTAVEFRSNWRYAYSG